MQPSTFAFSFLLPTIFVSLQQELQYNQLQKKLDATMNLPMLAVKGDATMMNQQDVPLTSQLGVYWCVGSI